MKKAICPGSFDPVTNGHIDIFMRAGSMAEELTVCVFHNVRKKSFFSVEERVALLRESTKHIPNIRVDSFSGLLTEYMKENGIRFIVRGLRSVSDFEYEQQSAQAIHHMVPGMETVFLLTDPRHAFVSSSLIRELVCFHGSIDGLVPDCVKHAIEKKYPLKDGD